MPLQLRWRWPQRTCSFHCAAFPASSSTDSACTFDARQKRSTSPLSGRMARGIGFLQQLEHTRSRDEMTLAPPAFTSFARFVPPEQQTAPRQPPYAPTTLSQSPCSAHAVGGRRRCSSIWYSPPPAVVHEETCQTCGARIVGVRFHRRGTFNDLCSAHFDQLSVVERAAYDAIESTPRCGRVVTRRACTYFEYRLLVNAIFL